MRSTTATEVIIPQMGESVAEGTITRWLTQNDAVAMTLAEAPTPSAETGELVSDITAVANPYVPGVSETTPAPTSSKEQDKKKLAEAEKNSGKKKPALPQDPTSHKTAA